MNKRVQSRFAERNRQTGFTLIEIMVVVVILGILASVVVINLSDRPDVARVTKAKEDIRGLETALEMYRMDNFQYPSTDQGIEALVKKPETPPQAANYRAGGYLKRLPNDPWGRPYVYLSPGVNGLFDLSTLGSDGQPGGEGFAADIENWSLK